MSERSKLSVSHLRRAAFVYLRQSTQAQLQRNVESTERQYGWSIARSIWGSRASGWSSSMRISACRGRASRSARGSRG